MSALLEVKGVTKVFPMGGVLSGNLNATFSNGVAAFTGLSVNLGGRWRVRITSATGLTTVLTFDTIGRQT